MHLLAEGFHFLDFYLLFYFPCPILDIISNQKKKKEEEARKVKLDIVACISWCSA
jgi:hypothetical protein